MVIWIPRGLLNRTKSVPKDRNSRNATTGGLAASRKWCTTQNERHCTWERYPPGFSARMHITLHSHSSTSLITVSHNGSFPAYLKISKVISLPKVATPGSLNDLRPIAITPIMFRITERILIKSFVATNYEEKIEARQHGFPVGGSTENALIGLHNDCRHFQSVGFDYVRVISLDFSKAFDKVKHNLLVEKLYGSQLHYHVINLFADFLTDRKQYVTMNGLMSKMLSFDLGVIQGTVSRPRFFNYYINDLFTDTETTRHSSFANDTIIATARYLDTGDESYQSLCSVIDWCQIHKLSLNTSKCRELLVQFREGHVECLTNIPRCASLKLLGVHIDTNFGFKTHIEKLSLKCRQLTFQINRLQKHAYSIKEMRHIFNAIVLPHITYCVSVYGGVPKKHLKKLSSAISLAKRLLHVTDDTDFHRFLHNNLIAKC